MNVTGLSDDINDTFALGNQSVEQYDDWRSNYTSEELARIEWERWLLGFSVKLSYIISYVVYALGIPGNILSAIVWMRRHITSEGPAALYLAALAINDLVFVAFDGVDTILELSLIHI